MEKCKFCDLDAEYSPGMNFSMYRVKCKNCGEYSLGFMDKDRIDAYLKDDQVIEKHILSGCIKELNDRGAFLKIITKDNYHELLKEAKPPKIIIDKIKLLIIYLMKSTKRLGQFIEVYRYQTSICYAYDTTELIYIFKYLINQKLIQLRIENDSIEQAFRNNESTSVSLTVFGIEYSENLLKVDKDTKTVFVAMWFSEYMKEIFSDFIHRAIKESGYEPLPIYQKEFNDDINDNIIIEIRNSKFIIADLTGDRGGVYYEAGFANGLGKEVIWTCKKDWFNEEVKEEITGLNANGEDVVITHTIKRKVHFDVDHNNFIIWEDDKREEFYTKLKNRIMSRFPL